MALITRRGFGSLAMAGLTAPRLALAAPTPLNVVAAKGQPYYAGSAFLAKVGPEYAVDITDAPTSSEALDSLLSGGIDVAYIGLITAVLAAARGRPIVAVASAGWKCARILARTESPIKTVKDLAGKNIGVSKSSSQDMILRKLLETAGLDPARDVNWILLPTNAHFEAMASGTVDAVTTSEPYGSFMLEKGIARTIADPYTTPINGVGIVLVFARDAIAKDPAAAQRIVNLHARATVYAASHPDEVVTTLMRQSRQTASVMQAAVANSALQYDVDDAYLGNARTLVGELVKAKYLGKPFDLASMLDLRFLPGARQAAGPVL